MRPRPGTAIYWLPALVLGLSSPRARAEEPTSPGVAAHPKATTGATDGARDGTIVRADRDRLYFDLGAGRGLVYGQTVEVLRTITARHPVTGAALVDHFPLGTLFVDSVGAVLSFGRAEKRIAALVAVGDVVRISSRPPLPAAPPPAKKPALASSAADTGATDGTDDAASAHDSPAIAEANALFLSLLGQPIADRTALVSRFLDEHPATPYRLSLSRELMRLRMVQATLEEAQSAIEKGEGEQAGRRLAASDLRIIATLSLPPFVYRGDTLEAAVYVANPDQLKFASLYLRRPGHSTYQRLPLQPDQEGYLRVRVPPATVTPPSLEAFVELVSQSGAVSFLGGDTRAPATVFVEDPPSAPLPPGPGHSAVSGFFEFVDFNRFRGNDYYLKAEADFMYRIGGYLYSVRTGFGALTGKGGSVADLDTRNLAPVDVGFNYAYVETEFRFHRLFGMAARLLGGQSVSGVGGGAELKLRIGSATGTNLVLGGSVISDFGALGLMQLEWNVIKNFPMSASVIATNQPVGKDVGVRLVYQVGWRARSWIEPTVRIGYDVRNINHGGLSLGLGLVMAW